MKEEEDDETEDIIIAGGRLHKVEFLVFVQWLTLSL